MSKAHVRRRPLAAAAVMAAAVALGAAQQGMDGLPGRLCAQIPEGEIQRTQRVHGEAAPADVVAGVVKLVPQCGVAGIAAEQHAGQPAGVVVGVGSVDERLDGRGEGLHLADAGAAVIRGEAHHAIVVGAVEQRDAGVFVPEVEGFDLG